MELMHIPLCELSIAKTNVRHGVKKADISDLIPSIRKRGILQPLLVRKNGKGHEVVAGKRRYLTLQFLEKEGVEIEAVPCAVIGEVETHEGYLSRVEVRKREAKGKGKSDTETKSEKPELTKPMQNYFGLHRHAAVRLELLNHPQIALRLAVAHMIVGSRLWQVRPEPQRADKPEIEASVMQSKAQQAFAEKRQSVCDLLGLDPDRSELVRPNGDDYQTVAVFAQLLKLTDDEVMHVLAFAMAETLEAGTAVVEAVGVKTNTDMANTWTPDDTFLALLAGKDVLHAVLSELGGPSVADSNKGETGKVQKGIIRDFITGSNGRPQVQNWLPAYARFPAAAYTDRGGTGGGDSWKKVAALFESAST